jgi:hypothetical protein
VLNEVKGHNDLGPKFKEQRLQRHSSVLLYVLPEAVLLPNGEELKDGLNEGQSEIGHQQIDVVGKQDLLHLVDGVFIQAQTNELSQYTGLLRHYLWMAQGIEY